MPLGITAFFPVNLDIGHITRSAERNEHYEIINTGKALAFGRYIGNLYLGEQWQLFAFS